MKSDYPKVMHKVAGQPMVMHVVAAARRAGVERIILVLGHGRDQVEKVLAGKGLEFVVQEEQLGTGHALMQAEKLVDPSDNVLVLCGDTPLLQAQTLCALREYHRERGAQATVLSTRLADPTGYGRIVRDEEGKLQQIVEEKDAPDEIKAIDEINSGLYCFEAQAVFQALKDIKPDNAQKEYYLTDVLPIMMKKGLKVEVFFHPHAEEVYGINDRIQLAYAEKIMRQRKNRELMVHGVTMLDPDSTFIDAQVEIGPDTVIYPFTIIEGNTRIGSNCVIGPEAHVVDSVIGDEVRVERSKLVECEVGEGCNIGPFAYIRPGTILGRGVKVGDFVEIKKSVIDEGSKVPHLAYVGDAQVGKRVNIGAGTITCNYDGKNKHLTVIEDDAFIGSNTNLVAPVRIGRGAVTGAGSTITKEVPPGALAVERAKQKNIEGPAKRKNRLGEEGLGGREEKP